MLKSPIVKRSIVIHGHKTSISLESWAWRHFRRIAATAGITHSTLAEAIDAHRPRALNLSAAIRRVVVEDLEQCIADLLGEHADAYEHLVGRGEPLLPSSPPPARAARGGEGSGVGGATHSAAAAEAS